MPEANNDVLLKEESADAKKINRTLWLVEHRAGIARIGIIALIIVDVVLVLFVAWSLVDAFLISAGSHEKTLVESILANQEDLHAYTVARAAAPIDVSAAQVFPIGGNKYDFYAQLQNTNADWWAEFDYQFVYSGGATPVRRGFILPSSKKPLAELAYTTDGSVAGAQLEFQSISWHRVDHHLISDYIKWSGDRLGFEVQNIALGQDTAINPQGMLRTTFTVKNRTAYSYNQPTFYLLLKRGQSVVAVNKVVMQSLESGQTQDVAVNWFGLVSTGNQVEIVPDINLFDPNQYKALRGTSTIDSRLIAP